MEEATTLVDLLSVLKTGGLTTLTFGDIKPFLIGALVTALALFVMTSLFYFGRHRMIIAICILTTAILLIVKWIYAIP